MSKYGDAAVLASKLLNAGEATDPREAWVRATKRIFPSNLNLQNKGCPKGAFLGLCNEGLVVGVPPGNYSKSTKNGKYAIDAVTVLRANRFLTSQPDMLWKKVTGGTVSENHQMDVVIGLWESNCIKK